MPRNINIFFSNFRLGTNVTFARRLMDVTANFTTDAGTPGTVTEAVVFPDILADIPAERRDELLKELIITLLKIKHGVDV